jgi:CubicO group peptidase (beta-lactamase class C family)
MQKQVDALPRRIDAAIDKAIAEKRIVGAVVLVNQDGREVYGRAAGQLDREAGTPMRRDAIFRLASFTKPVVAAAALALIELGKLSLDDVVTKWLPDFRPKLRDGTAPDIRVRQLLNHTSGLAYATLLPDDPYRLAKVSGALDQPSLSLEENLRRLASVPLLFAPGTAWRYGLSIDVLGAIMEKVTGRPLGDAVADLITGPLSMRDTIFGVTDTKRLAVPYADGKNGPIRMGQRQIVREDPAMAVVFSPGRILDPKSYQSGGAGLAGTADDFMKFLEAIQRGGAPILKRETVRMASENQIGDLPRDETETGWRFGFLSAVMADPAAAKSPHSIGTLEWGGAWGHRWFVDPVERLSVVYLTNTAMEGVSGAFPIEMREAVYGRST